MLTQLEVDAINKAFRDALGSYNSNAREKVVENKATFSTCAQYLKSEGVDQASWTHKNIWSAAILAIHDQLEKVAIKSREQIEQERRAADSAAGRQRYIKNNDGYAEPKGNLDDLLANVKNEVERMFNPTEQSAPDQPKTDWPTFQVDFEQMEPIDRKKFLVLSAADTKAWMKRRAVVKHRQKYNLDPVEQ